MSKAYDRLEWAYLKAVLISMKFPSKFIDSIMNCVSTVSYTFFRLNGKIFGAIKPSRGLRQGDPLSPLLFVLCAQGLSSMLHALGDQGKCGMKVSKNGPLISHLFFADDSLLFCPTTITGCRAIKEGLLTYEKASGQHINLDKSSIAFSPNVKDWQKEMALGILGMKGTTGHSLYLGLPTYSMRSKKMQFHYTVERVAQKIHAWKGRLLSTGGKEVLINVVIQSIPTYAMSVFRIPVAICKEIERLCARFWWRDKEQESGIHWKAWSILCRPKGDGGMGFRDLCAFNKSLSAKNVWKLIQQPSSLLVRVFKARYYPSLDIMDCKVGSNASFIWRSLCWSQDIVERGAWWKIGDGKSVKVFKDAWVAGLHTGKLLAMQGRDQQLMVADIMTRDQRWDMEQIHKHLLPCEAALVSEIEIPKRSMGAIRYLAYEERGGYIAKSGYRLQMGFFDGHQSTSVMRAEEWSRKFWSLGVPPKVKIFGWRAYHGLVPVDLQLHRYHIPTDGICWWCKRDWGSVDHTLLFCDVVRPFWKNTYFWRELHKIESVNFVT